MPVTLVDPLARAGRAAAPPTRRTVRRSSVATRQSAHDLALGAAARAPCGCCRCRRRAGSRRLLPQVQAEVEDLDRVGQRADRDEVDAGLGDLAGPLEGEAARRPRGWPGRPVIRTASAISRRSTCCRAGSASQPASSSARSWSRSVTSTSTGRSGCGRAHRLVAPARTPPAATTWLSLTIAMSARLNRWLTPPPQRTAYFCSARYAGSVLRVSSTRARVPSSASTQAAVAVATPERWQAKLRAVRSAVSRPRTGPSTLHHDVAGCTRVPSGTRPVTSTASPMT